MNELRRRLRSIRYGGGRSAFYVVTVLWLVGGAWSFRQWQDVEPIPAPPPRVWGD